MTALENLIADLREQLQYPVPTVMLHQLETILDALEAAEQRAETLRGALERLHVAGKDAADALSFRPIREPLREALTAAERALKGDG